VVVLLLQTDNEQDCLRVECKCGDYRMFHAVDFRSVSAPYIVTVCHSPVVCTPDLYSEGPNFESAWTLAVLVILGSL
jgi:hypothetical protein